MFQNSAVAAEKTLKTILSKYFNAMSVFIVFASRRGDFEEMMDVRGEIGELTHQSSPCTDIKARSATSSTGVFYVFFSIPISRTILRKPIMPSEQVHITSIRIEVVVFTLIHDWSKINQKTYRDFCQAHIVPKLLTLSRPQGLNGLTFDNDVALTKKISIMLVLQRMSVEGNREVILLLIRYFPLRKEYGQSLLIHVFIEEGTKSSVYFLTATIQIITILPKLFAQTRIHIRQLLNGIFHNDSSFLFLPVEEMNFNYSGILLSAGLSAACPWQRDGPTSCRCRAGGCRARHSAGRW